MFACVCAKVCDTVKQRHNRPKKMKDKSMLYVVWKWQQEL